jgi:hypothetical protein
MKVSGVPLWTDGQRRHQGGMDDMRNQMILGTGKNNAKTKMGEYTRVLNRKRSVFLENGGKPSRLHGGALRFFS